MHVMLFERARYGTNLTTFLFVVQAWGAAANCNSNYHGIEHYLEAELDWGPLSSIDVGPKEACHMEHRQVVERSNKVNLLEVMVTQSNVKSSLKFMAELWQGSCAGDMNSTVRFSLCGKQAVIGPVFASYAYSALSAFAPVKIPSKTSRILQDDELVAVRAAYRNVHSHARTTKFLQRCAGGRDLKWEAGLMPLG